MRWDARWKTAGFDSFAFAFLQNRSREATRVSFSIAISVVATATLSGRGAAEGSGTHNGGRFPPATDSSVSMGATLEAA